MRRLVVIGLLFVLGAMGPPAAHAQADSTYVVQSGDTLFRIAQRFETSVEALRRWNDLSNSSVQVGQTLRVRPPGMRLPDASAADSAVHVVERGETLYGVAQQHGVSVQAIQRWNNLADVAVRAGQRLRVRPPVEGSAPPSEADTLAARADTAASPDTSTALPPPPAARPDTEAGERERDPSAGETGPPSQSRSFVETMRPVEPVPAEKTLIGEPIDPLQHGTYVIQRGDTFYSIAARYGTTGDSLFALNNRFADPLPPGRVVRLPERFSVPSHTVRSGESIYDIAAQYGVSVRTLRTANALDTTEVAAGQRLQIPGRTAPEPPVRELPLPDARGPVVHYPETFEGRLTASGIPYDSEALVVSHPTFSFGTIVLLTNPAAGRSTFAKVVDRGPVEDAMLVDVSDAVAEQLGIERGSNQPIELRVVR